MNLLLFHQYELNPCNHFCINDDRATHLKKVLNVTQGSYIKAGMINGKIGRAQITDIEAENIHLHWQAESDPPPPLPCVLIVALPRPKMMRRILQTIATMGVKEIHFINSWKVEKSFWQTPWLEPDAIKSQLLLGLAQAVDTELPQVFTHKRFKPFVQDILPTLCLNRENLAAHPYQSAPCPTDLNTPSLMCIGPEGGFTEYEVNLLKSIGITAVSIGARILRTETAIPAILSRLYPA